MKTFVRQDPKSQYTLVDVLKKDNERSVFAKYYIEKGVVISCDIEFSNDKQLNLLPFEKALAGNTQQTVVCVGFGFYLKRTNDINKINCKAYSVDKENMKIHFEFLKSVKPGQEIYLMQ